MAEKQLTVAKPSSPSTWNQKLAEQCRANIYAGLSVNADIVKQAPRGFISELRKQRKAALRRQRSIIAHTAGGISANEVRAQFKAQGLRGRELTRKVNAVLAGQDAPFAKHEEIKKLSAYAEAKRLGPVNTNT
jgi:hypothetical protein